MTAGSKDVKSVNEGIARSDVAEFVILFLSI
jgi:hypothetical protein